MYLIYHFYQKSCAILLYINSIASLVKVIGKNTTQLDYEIIVFKIQIYV